MTGPFERLGWLVALALALTLARPAAARADSAAAKNNEGNLLYSQKQLDEALKMYTEAQVARPEAPELHYNIGNVLYRKKEFDKALDEYRKAQAAKDPRLAQAALFNRGNALMQSGKVQDAVGAYVQALRARPDDPDAKRNLELALRMLQEQKKKQNAPSEPKDDQPKNPPPQPRPQTSEPGPGEPRPSQPQPRPGQMSPEEARRILDALRDQEKEGMKKHAQAAPSDRRPPEKDW